MKLQNYHRSLEQLHVGTEENRAYYIPYPEKEAALIGADASNNFMLLNGDWHFKYYNGPHQVPEGAVKGDYPVAGFSRIQVPSTWQNSGFDKHQYTNVKLPIPFDPPHVPLENPCGLYKRTFRLREVGENLSYYINFEGVDACYYLYINDKFAGFSQVSHSTSEFDISAYVNKGINSISVLVLKWCSGTYLEDQDKFRQSGIFRDVYILARPKNHLRDYFVKTKINNNSAAIIIEAETKGEINVEAALFSPSGELISEIILEKGRGEFTVENPVLWNGEAPVLYTLLFSCGGEFIRQRVGIRSVEVKNGVLLFNGEAIKFYGVNRHDSDPVTGPAISRAQALRDLMLMKQHNINAVRTSHYPNAPWFVQMCEEYGFYVIDETDIEAHSCVEVYGGGYLESYGLIAQDPRFEEAILDRMQRCVIRDKNSCAVIMWSLGNEAGYGPGFEKAGRWVKSYDDSRLVHYEGSIHQTGGHINDTSMLDVHSRMYAPLQDIHDYFANPENTKPFILCEFIHAMGNSVGDSEDYYELFEQYPGFCGGFVWEWCDHGVYMGKTADGRVKYAYGGDFGEFPHDGNFCVDGLVSPDRKPHTSLIEYKNVCRPLRAKAINLEKGEFEFTNKLAFTNTVDILRIEYDVEQDGTVVSSGSAHCDIKGHGSGIINMDYEIPAKGSCYLNIRYVQTAAKPFTWAGHILGIEQFELRREKGADWQAGSGPALSFEEDESRIIVKSSKLRYVFSKIKGNFENIIMDNISYIEKPMEFNIWRAPIDNDRRERPTWEEAGYDRALISVYSTSVAKAGGGVEINCNFSICPLFIQPIIKAAAKWLIQPDGSICLSLDAEKDPVFPMLPRFGLRMFLNKELNNIEYFGYGPTESYVDKHRASWRSKFSGNVEEMHEDYIKPQENSSHWDCGYVRASGNRGSVLVEGENSFSFNASVYTQEELGRKKHNYELEKSGYTVLCVDYAQNGIGSNSCGPKLLEKYRFNDSEINFSWRFSFK